ncbi:hypothetical protein [Pseudoduganella sp. R-43]|uniref:hypothetical protein n=1 Tax=unclassified Pseudoduganella TaxID=2637179 RepID=UPI003CEF594E
MDHIEFVSSLEACTLPPEHFNHAGHVRLACHYLAQHPLDEAIVRTCATIRSYAAAWTSLGLGAPEIEHIRSWSRRMGV